jgi:hypothetical protein
MSFKTIAKRESAFIARGLTFLSQLLVAHRRACYCFFTIASTALLLLCYSAFHCHHVNMEEDFSLVRSNEGKEGSSSPGDRALRVVSYRTLPSTEQAQAAVAPNSVYPVASS